jgi:uncharacterized membrane protein YdbT with pleckstrin-like domain
MSNKMIVPHRNYLTKFRIVVSLYLLIITGFMLIFAWPMAAEGAGVAALIYSLVCLGLCVFGIVLTLFLSVAYFNSLKYEILEDEVIVRAGIITKSVKHVPYRTVTNLVVKRGIMDRMFGLGSLHIQTAGMSGNTNAAEESLVGLENVQEVYELVAAELRRFRGGMTPTQAESEPLHPQIPQNGDLHAMLEELKAIRVLLEKK